mmetsp:Transcript_32646/g.75893  ORF Transcript_32646/g.75893 Transcript_32646/m.75893 type:complete len:87 (+) Transcript_32646:72-332(+)|eukprot:CAMPEP_0171096838 /NCGR_PEP_ID=MMETSP0766_2-20121228/46063_1 /TAXON_ID=439317 /ORGANISM="Gambierdiscus australes, Strain CAWD 149" /LENGTH=86 /DNA_ID=CAMNT_0011555909 /DNA_START=71 /DNA_END=331 /DNA_ORIENTATION=-
MQRPPYMGLEPSGSSKTLNLLVMVLMGITALVFGFIFYRILFACPATQPAPGDFCVFQSGCQWGEMGPTSGAFGECHMFRWSIAMA